jgi:hypothetical protein
MPYCRKEIVLRATFALLLLLFFPGLSHADPPALAPCRETNLIGTWRMKPLAEKTMRSMTINGFYPNGILRQVFDKRLIGPAEYKELLPTTPYSQYSMNAQGILETVIPSVVFVHEPRMINGKQVRVKLAKAITTTKQYQCGVTPKDWFDSKTDRIWHRGDMVLSEQGNLGAQFVLEKLNWSVPGGLP